MDLGDIANRLHDRALEHGAECADVLVAADDAVTINVCNSKLEHAERSDSVVIGIRVLIGRRQACISGSDARPEALDDMVCRAVGMARLAPVDKHLGLAAAEQLTSERDSTRLELTSPERIPGPGDLEAMAMEIESAALDVPGISKVEASSTSFGSSVVHVRQTNGFEASRKRSYRSAGCAAIAGDGLAMETDYYGESRVFQEDMSSCREIGRIAGERTVARLNPQRPKTGLYPVIFDRRVAASLVGHLLSAINGEAISRGSSWLLDGLGTDVMPENVSVIEDPHRRRSLSSRVFDAEGLPTSCRDIVRDGVLQTWILDLATARKLGLSSTSNASRGPASPPRPSTSNIVLTPGTRSREDLEKEMGDGLVVTSLIGSTINPTTGDYSRGASGYWVANGERVGPVSEFTIAGNLRTMLRTIVPANDADPFRRYSVPGLLVEGMTIAGN